MSLFLINRKDNYNTTNLDQDYLWFNSNIFSKFIYNRKLSEKSYYKMFIDNEKQLKFVNDLENYLERPMELWDLSPYCFYSFYKIVPKDKIFDKRNVKQKAGKSKLQRYSLNPSHKLFNTHMIIKQKKMKILQIITKILNIPDDESTDEIEKKKYASFAKMKYWKLCSIYNSIN